MPELIWNEAGDVIGMNVPALKLVLGAIQRVQSAQMPHPGQGVCSNVNYYTRRACVSGYQIMPFFAEDWPHSRRQFCGRLEAYFIPEDIHHDTWSGPNWRMRHNFMEHAVRKIETMLKAQGGTDA